MMKNWARVSLSIPIHILYRKKKKLIQSSFFINTEEDDYNDEEVITCTIFRMNRNFSYEL